VSDQPTAQPTVLFVCVHNAGRSQMAAGYLAHLGGGRIRVLSAGSQPADAVNPAAVAAMAEEGIDISAATPRVLTPEAVQVSDVVVTMGCGDACPFYPGTRYETGSSTTRRVRASTPCGPSATRSVPGSRR
jgi:arsenate reductase